MPDNGQFWMQCTENALRVQQQRFEEVAASYMLETEQAFQTERAAWLQRLLLEEQRMAAHGRHEAEVERNQVEHQMMETFKRYAAQQSAQFEQTAQAERQYLTNAAKSEVESSRQELVLAQARFQETSSQQSVQISTLRGGSRQLGSAQRSSPRGPAALARPERELLPTAGACRTQLAAHADGDACREPVGQNATL